MTGVLRRLGRDVLHVGAWGACDQAVISASGFITTVLLARSVGPTEFGTFTLVYMLLLFANSLQSALITQPQSVLGATRQGDAYARYVSSIAAGQLVLSLALGLLTWIVAAAAAWAGLEFAHLLGVVAPAIVAWQLQEFVRRTFYTEGRPRLALANDLVSYGGQAALIVILWQAGSLTPHTAFYALIGTSTLAAIWGLWLIRGVLVPVIERGAFGENLKFGKWLLGASLTQWTSSQLNPILIATFASVAETGIFRAVLVVMGPTHVLINGMHNWFAPGAARAFAGGGDEALQGFMVRVCALTMPLMVGYCVLVSVFAGPLLGFLLGLEYAQYGWLLAMLALAYLLTFTAVPMAIALQARGESAPLFQANLWSTVIMLTAGVAAVRALGVFGAALGSVMHGVVENIVLWRCYRAAKRPMSPLPSA